MMSKIESLSKSKNVIIAATGFGLLSIYLYYLYNKKTTAPTKYNCNTTTYQCDGPFDTGTYNSLTECQTNCVQPTHKECQNGSCVNVSGTGTNQCTSNADCQIQTHKECQSGSCVNVSGTGTNQCTTDSNCKHKECVNGICTYVNGVGTDKCTTDINCQHNECQNGVCVSITGVGTNQCTSSANCQHKECINLQCQYVNGIGEDKCISNSNCDDLYYLKTSISVFGNFPGVAEHITEFKQFIENNSKLRLNLTINYYSKLQDSEICPSIPNCYEATCLLPATKQKIPFHQMSNIILYEHNWDQKPVCYAGACYCYVGTTFVPTIIIPTLWNSDDPWGPWNHTGSQIITHEWMHSLDYTFAYLGYPDFPHLDGICETLGYNPENDPGWARCYKYFLTLITQNMYYDLERYNENL